MEKDVKIKTPDGKFIYGVLNKSNRPQPRGLIIYAHGLTSSISSYTYLQSARMFEKFGYDTLRIGFYDWRPEARCLSDCSLQTHATDLRTAIDRFGPKYNRVYLIGHSWGGPTIMQTDCTGITAISLWEPSYNSAEWFTDFTKQGNFFLRKGAIEFVISKEMRDDVMRMDINECRLLSSRVTLPLQVLHAGKTAFFYKYKESYHTHAHGPTDYHLIKTADHQFLAEDAMKQAVTLTHKWFSKFK